MSRTRETLPRRPGRRSSPSTGTGRAMTDDHTFPDREHAAERYLLGEMSDADRERYEEHFFSCAECAEDVRTTAAFLDDARKYVVPRFPAQTATAVPVSP